MRVCRRAAAASPSTATVGVGCPVRVHSPGGYNVAPSYSTGAQAAPQYSSPAQAYGNTVQSPPPTPQQHRPSKVLHIRQLPDSVADADIIDQFSQFGTIEYVSLTGRGTALIEFESIQSAEQCVTYNATTDILFGTQAAFVSFAPMAQIPRRGCAPNAVAHLTIAASNRRVRRPCWSCPC